MTHCARSDALPLLWIGGWSIAPHLHPFPSEAPLLTRRIIPIDLSACKSADAFVQVVARTITRLQTEVDIAAWSLGTQLALKVHTLLGNRIRRMALFSATPKFTRNASTGWTTGLAASTMRSTKRRLQVDRSQALTDFHQLMLGSDWHPESGWLTTPCQDDTQGAHKRFTAEFLPGTSPWSTQALVTGLEVLESTDLRDSVGDVRTRTLLVHGVDDRVCPIDAGRWLTDRLPQAQLIEVEGAEHCPHLFLNPQAHREVEAFLS